MNLPPGYVAINKSAAVHQAMLRQHVKNPKRFIQCLPAIKELADCEPGNVEQAIEVAHRHGISFPVFLEACHESIALDEKVWAILEGEADPGDAPEPLFFVEREGGNA